MLQPKKTKYRFQFKGENSGKAYRGSTLSFGDYGLKALEVGRLTNRQIEAARITMSRFIKRGGKIWIRIFPDIPYTKKPAETRMGKGKGGIEGWAAKVLPGRIMYEIEGVPVAIAKEAFRLASHKLPIKTKFVMREDSNEG